MHYASFVYSSIFGLLNNFWNSYYNPCLVLLIDIRIADLLEKNISKLNIKLILSLHKTLLTNIDDNIAGRFRSGKEWVRVGHHLGVNPQLVVTLMQELMDNYNQNKISYFSLFSSYVNIFGLRNFLLISSSFVRSFDE